MFITSGSTQLHTVEFGTGPSTILAHGGWTGSWELWTEPFSRLSKTWRTVAYDHRGSGVTIAPVDSITVENMVADLFKVMDVLEIHKCVLAGESAGGMVAVTAALQCPERFNGLVLVDALTHNENDGSNAVFIQGLKKDFEKTVERFVDACVPENSQNWAEIRSWGRKILTRASPEASVRLIEYSFGIDLRPNLSQLKIPTLILHGENDVIVPLSDSETAANQIPNNLLRVFKDAGHVPTMTHPQAVADKINNYFRKWSAP
jgi:3-oxoadipate enol-lactonase